MNSLALAFLLLPMIILGDGNSVLANNVISGVTTNVTLFFDGKVISFETDSFNLDDAIADKGVELGRGDIVEPSGQTALSGGSVTATIKRAIPIKVYDDGRAITIMSGYEDPMEALKQNEIRVYKEDRVFSDLVFDFFSENSLGRKIIIKRAPVFYVDVDKEEREYRSWKNTVKEVLDEKGVLIGDMDKVEPARDHYVVNGMSIRIIRVAESEVTERETIPFGEKVEEDVMLEYGKTYVKQAGKSGEKKHTYKIISENGAMVSKTLIKTETVSSPVTKIVIKGTKPFNAGQFWETIVRASDNYGVSASKMHRVMLCESGGNPYAGGYYKGLFQYAPSTWAGASYQYPGGVYAGANIYDPIAQIYVTAWKASVQGWGAWGCQ